MHCKGEHLLDGAWRVDYEGARKGVWWWWFWLFFLKDPKSKKPVQLMVLWSTKKESKMECNDVPIHLGKPLRELENAQLGTGVVAAWLFDGKKLHENFLLDQGALLLDRKNEKLELTGKQHGLFQRKGKKFEIKLEKRDAHFEAEALMEGEGGIPEFRLNTFLKKFKYQILKLTRVPCHAVLEMEGKKRALPGTAYFQNVCIQAPTVPWLWGVVHFGEGSFLSYMVPRLGASLVKEDLVHFLKANLPISKRFEFYHARRKKWYRFKKWKIRNVRRKAGVAWLLKAKSAEAELEMELESYAKALWKLGKQRRLPFKEQLYYNEYAVVLTRFAFRSPDGKETLESMKGGVGNCEHAWGFLT